MDKIDIGVIFTLMLFTAAGAAIGMGIMLALGMATLPQPGGFIPQGNTCHFDICAGDERGALFCNSIPVDPTKCEGIQRNCEQRETGSLTWQKAVGMNCTFVTQTKDNKTDEICRCVKW